MNEYAWVSLVGLVAWLFLAVAGFRAHRVSGRKTVLMAAAWIGIFSLVSLRVRGGSAVRGGHRRLGLPFI